MKFDYKVNGECIGVSSTLPDVQDEVDSRHNELGPYSEQIVVYQGLRHTYLMPSNGRELAVVHRFLKSSLFTKAVKKATYLQRGCFYIVQE